MSYILEALKKADQERTLGSVPDLETPHWGARRAARNYRWLWVVGALMLVNGVLLAFLIGLVWSVDYRHSGEIMARTDVGLDGVVLALASGAAAVLPASSRPRSSSPREAADRRSRQS